MKKIGIGSIPVIIGCANWIIVVIMLAVLLIEIAVNPKVTPKGMYAIMEFIGYCLRYSFLPALISLALTVIAKREDRTFNLAINALFLFLYTLVFLFVRHMVMSA